MPTPEDLHPDLKILRLTLMRELETVNQYQDFFDEAGHPAVKELMGHLMFEEKEHVAELTEMLKLFDPDQLSHFAGTHAAEIGGAFDQIPAHVNLAVPQPSESDQAASAAGHPALEADPPPANSTPQLAAVLSPAFRSPDSLGAPVGLPHASPNTAPPAREHPNPAPPTGPIAALRPFTVGSLLGLPQA